MWVLRKVGPSLRTWPHFPLSEALRRRAECLLTFHFFLYTCAVFVKATFPKPGCNSCYSSCAVCPTRSWKDRKTDLENYFMYVIGDYRTACAWRWQPHAVGLAARRQATNNAVQHPSSLKASLLLSCEEHCVSAAQPRQRSLPVEKPERKLHQAAGPRRPETYATFNFFHFYLFHFSRLSE